MSASDEAAVQAMAYAIRAMRQTPDSVRPSLDYARAAYAALAPHLAVRDAATWAQACEAAAQLAFDATTDDPQPSWNDACEHIAKAIRALTPPQPQSGGTE